MKENTLLKIALICSLVGLVILYFISEKVEIRDYNPTQLNKNVGDDVGIKGVITKISDKGNVVFVEVKQEYPVSIVIFSQDNNLNLKNGDNVEVVGKVQEYNGKNEIITQKIRIIK